MIGTAERCPKCRGRLFQEKIDSPEPDKFCPFCGWREAGGCVVLPTERVITNQFPRNVSPLTNEQLAALAVADKLGVRPAARVLGIDDGTLYHWKLKRKWLREGAVIDG